MGFWRGVQVGWGTAGHQYWARHSLALLLIYLLLTFYLGKKIPNLTEEFKNSTDNCIIHLSSKFASCSLLVTFAFSLHFF